MEQELLKTAEIVSWAGVALIFIWKVMAPLTMFFIGKLTGNGNGYEKRIKDLETYKVKLQTNDLHDFDDFKNDVKGDIQKLWNKVDGVDNRLRGVEKSVAVLESRMK